MALKVTFLQFGTGKFIKGYFDWMLSKTDINSEVFAVYFTPKVQYTNLKNNKCIFNVTLKDINYTQTDNVSVIKDLFWAKDTKVIFELANSIDFIVSNTTEKGILDKRGYPLLLTSFLYKKFELDNNKMLVIIPLELIPNNGEFLKQTILKIIDENYTDSFKFWVLRTCEFVNTIVDCIVTKESNLNIERERYYAFYVSKNSLLEKIFNNKGLNVYFTKDIDKIAQIKIKVLNGIHTFLVLTAYMEGKNTVYECFLDKHYINLINKLFYDEIFPTINYDKNFVEDFYLTVINRFKNPYIEHNLKDIALNTYEKFYQRIATTIVDYEKLYNQKPKILMKAFDNLKKMYPDRVKSFENYIENFEHEN
ncbi:MAG: hypothetical protein ACP5IH_05445 [Desulfurella sp.]|uniref:mannitol dehydrogenase family protein n=1 Tax=Desulfurella sp. TaxID=1962857 RepID=UPI003D133118